MTFSILEYSNKPNSKPKYHVEIDTNLVIVLPQGLHNGFVPANIESSALSTVSEFLRKRKSTKSQDQWPIT